MHYSIESQWETGFNANILIKNIGITAITLWELKFNFTENQQITSLWNGNFNQRDKMVIITNANWNKKIEPNQIIEIVFTATFSGINNTPKDFTLNGQSPVQDYGYIETAVDKPSFSETIFKPQVTIGNITREVEWGGTAQFKLEAEKEYRIEAIKHENEQFIYKPTIEPEKVIVEKGVTQDVNINYKEVIKDLDFTIQYNVESQWQSGFNGKIIINNTGALVITPWALVFHFPGDQQITSLWNGVLKQVGQKVTITNTEWNKEIKPNESVEIGFSAAFSGVNSKPTDFTLNGKHPAVYYGNVEVTISKPPFSEKIFKPKITIGGITQEIIWGETGKFKLQAEREYLIEANSFKGEKFIYKPDIKPDVITVEKDITKEVDITYKQTEINANVFCGYFPSWKDRWSSKGELTDLGNLPSYVNRVLLAFAKPNMIYNEGNFDITQTGLEFSYDANVLKQAIDYLKERNPETKVLISIGGATYVNWGAFNPKSIAQFVKDFNLDGVDLDYEPSRSWGCKPDTEGIIHCDTDNEYVSLIEKMRAELPRPYILSASPISVGAYGEDEWKSAPPANMVSTGMMLQVINKAGDKLDMLNVQGYNAGPEFDPLQATQAYSYYFNKIVAMGAMVPPEEWSTGRWTIDDIYIVGKYINDNNIGGLMLWDLYRKTAIADSQTMSSAIAEILGFPNYKDPLFPLQNTDTLYGKILKDLSPQKPTIHIEKFFKGNGYNIIMHNEQGINGSHCILYQNGIAIDYVELEVNTPESQSVKFNIQYNPEGIYTYRVELKNEYGSIFSDYLVINCGNCSSC